MRVYMERRVTPPRRVTSPARGPPPPCEKALTVPSHCCLFNNCVQFTTFYMQRFTTVLRKMQTTIFLLLVIVMDSIKSNLSVNFVEGIQ